MASTRTGRRHNKPASRTSMSMGFDYSRYHSTKVKETGINLLGVSYYVFDLIRSTIAECARSKANVLVLGETGTGKELVVDHIRRGSRVDENKYQVVNCAQFTRELLASELFGHVKGAFTGAGHDKPGLIESVDGGALFLDELGAMPQDLQAQLLRVIQDGTYRRVGDTKARRLRHSTRFFAATNKPDDVRPDLRWRFQRQIVAPPLRERRSDVFAILQGYLDRKKQEGRLRPDVEWVMGPRQIVEITYSRWPGNIRELLNAIETSIDAWEFDGCKDNRIRFYYSPGPEAGEMLQDLTAIKRIWLDLCQRAATALSLAKRLPHEYPFSNRRMKDILSASAKSQYSGDRDEVPVTFSCLIYNMRDRKPLPYHFTPGDAPLFLCLAKAPDLIDFFDCTRIGDFSHTPPTPIMGFWMLDSREPPPLPAELASSYDPLSLKRVDKPALQEPILTGYSEERLLTLYYGQMKARWPTQKEAAQAAGISEDQVRNRYTKYCHK